MLTAFVLHGAPPASAGVTTEANIYAKVAPSVEIAGASTLRFGTFARSGEPGTAELSPASGLVHCNMTSVGRDEPSPALLTVSAHPGQTFGIAVSNIARVGRGPFQLEVSTFTHDAGSTPVVDASGAMQIRFGATIYVSARTPSGMYKGNFDVIVTNN